MKRFFDVLGAATLLVLTSPVIVVSLVLIRLRSPAGGGAIFRQTREGRDGRPFTMYKLRTMHGNAEALLDDLLRDPVARAEWTDFRRINADPRVIPGVGRWLRRTSVDELPQLWNVLRGDMSLVGPRPLEIEVARRLPPDAMAIRRTVRPGITGLWQVSGRSDHDLYTLCRVDVEYVQRLSVRSDLAILLRTPSAMVSGRGAY